LGKNSRWLGVHWAIEKRLYTAVGVVTLFLSFAAVAGTSSSQSGCIAPSRVVPGKFVDISEKAGVHFLHNANHTATKYQIETMGSGVGLFDCDNDGRLDIYLVNGASYRDPEPRGSIPQKSGPGDWDRMFHQKPDGTFEDVTEKSGLKGVGLGMGVAIADLPRNRQLYFSRRDRRGRAGAAAGCRQHLVHLRHLGRPGQ
jgi:hypothetical protein